MATSSKPGVSSDTAAPRTHLICDFDGTIAKSSTLNILASIGYSRNPDVTPWSEISAAYMRDLHRHDQTYTKPRNGGIQEELEYLDSLRPVESASIQRIEAAGVFKNVTPSDLTDGAAQAVREDRISFRPGWDRLVHEIQSTGGWTEVISVSWSRAFIRAAIETAFPAVLAECPDFKIAANDVQEDGSGELTRPFANPDGGIWTASDKARLVDEMLERCPRTIYVGDSVTDLRCLLDKSIVGIIVRDETMTGEQKELKETLNRSRVVVKHISEWKEDETSTALYWIKDFGEVCESPLFTGGR